MPDMSLDDQIDFLKRWAADNKCYFQDEGQVGFGRECVGIVKDGHYPAYRAYEPTSYDEVHCCWEAAPPEGVVDSYHKADILAVLGRGPDAIGQLYVWVKHLADHDIVVRAIPRRPAHDIDAMFHGFEEHILIKRGG